MYIKTIFLSQPVLMYVNELIVFSLEVFKEYEDEQARTMNVGLIFAAFSGNTFHE